MGAFASIPSRLRRIADLSGSAHRSFSAFHVRSFRGRRRRRRLTGRKRQLARKLKSDRVLFTATVLLVCASIVMVYSASAVVAFDRFQQPYLFLTKQAMWAVLGLAVLAVTMRVDYRT